MTANVGKRRHRKTVVQVKSDLLQLLQIDRLIDNPLTVLQLVFMLTKILSNRGYGLA